MNQLDLFDRKATEYSEEELFEGMVNFDWAKGSPESLAYFFADTLKNLDSIILKRWQDRKNVDHCKKLFSIALARLEEENRKIDYSNPPYGSEPIPEIKATNRAWAGTRIVTDRLEKIGMYYEFEIHYHVGLGKWTVEVMWTVPVSKDRKECYGNIRSAGKSVKEAIRWVEKNYHCKIRLEGK